MTSILDVLETVRPGLPERWVSKAALRRVCAAAAPLSDGSLVFFLERGFSKPNTRVDFGFCYPYPAHRALLNGDELLARRIPFLWLEVDGARAGDPWSAGRLLCLDGKFGRQAVGRSAPSLTEKRLLVIAEAAHRQLLQEPLPTSVRGSLRTCFTALPVNGRLLHLCVMPSRQPPVMKVNVSLPKRALVSYLKSVGWPGSISSLSHVWRCIGPWLRTAKIDLTLSPSLRPKVGLEIHPSNTSFEGRRRVLAWLQSNGLADVRQCTDLCAWHGATQTRATGKPARVELDFGIKIVLDEKSMVDVKAYFHVACESLVVPAKATHARRKFDA
jgi:hypothetical protein